MRAGAVRAAGRVVVSASLVTVFGACGGTPPPGPAPQAQLPPAAPAPALPALPVPEAQVPKYEPKGRRDPFDALEGAQGAGGGGSLVTTAKLTGIVRSARATLALVETPEGIGYILKPGDTLGNGRLLEIGSDSVVFQVTQTPDGPSNRVVLRMAMD